MDITTLAAWGEFLGGIAVVVSLIYLASQIRQNSRQMRAATASASSQLVLQQGALIAGDADLARIYWDGLADRNSLSDSDRQRFDPLIMGMTEKTRQLLRFARDGLISSEVWDDEEKSMHWMAQQPGVQQWWAQWRSAYGGDYGEIFDRLIREGEAAG